MALDLITDVGAAKMAQALGSASAVKITHVALGDGAGAGYVPTTTQTALRGELARRPIESRLALAPQAWIVSTVFAPADTGLASVREMGFLDEDGELVTVWAVQETGEDEDRPRAVGVIDFVVQHVLHLDQAPEGAVIVDAPDDVFAMAQLALLVAQTRHHHRLFRNDLDHLRRHGAFPGA